VSDPNSMTRRRPTERAGRHLEPDARPNDFCNCNTTHGRVHERVIFAPAAGVPAASSPAPASLRPHMRGSEPCVPDRLEDRTPISCEWAEKEHTGWRAEPKVELDAPGVAFLGAATGAGAVAEAIVLRAKWRVSIPSSSSLQAPHGHQRGFECGAGVPVRIP